MIDQDFNPILIDFGMLSGGIFGDMAKNPCQGVWGTTGYTDLHLCTVGRWSVKCDVFSYGVVLLSLIAKRVVDKQHPCAAVNWWAKEEYKTKRLYSGGTSEFSLLHESLEKEPLYDALDGPKITKLAMSCVEFLPIHRPAMMEIIQCLQDLHGEAVGIKPLRDDA